MDILLQGVGTRSGTPVNNQSLSPSYSRGFGQAGLAAGQGYSQAFPSPLSSKGLTPPGLGGRVGGGIGNAIGRSGLAQLGASGLGNHLPRTTGLNPHTKGTGVFNLPVSQPVAPRYQSQLGQGLGGFQRQTNGVTGYGVERRNPLTGPPGPGLAPSSAAQNFGGGGLDYSQVKQRQMLQELQAQQRLMQQQQQQPNSAPYGQQQVKSAYPSADAFGEEGTIEAADAARPARSDASAAAAVSGTATASQPATKGSAAAKLVAKGWQSWAKSTRAIGYKHRPPSFPTIVFRGKICKIEKRRNEEDRQPFCGANLPRLHKIGFSTKPQQI